MITKEKSPIRVLFFRDHGRTPRHHRQVPDQRPARGLLPAVADIVMGKPAPAAFATRA
jgi:hypothetical protein